MRRIAVLLVAIGFLFGRGAFGATELISNGGFESGASPWQPALGLANVPVVANPVNAHNGSTSYLSLGNFNGIFSARVYQTVTIPANTLLAKYSFFWGAESSDPTNTVKFSPVVLNTSQAVLFDPGVAYNANLAYQQQTFDLTSLAGQTVEIAFQVDALNAGIGVQSFFAVDDVSLISYTTNDIPVNDNFTNATLLTANVSVLATNVLATKEPGEPKHAGNSGGHSVWWKWTAPANGVLNLNTAGSTLDTLLGVYTGATVSNLAPVAANDDNSSRGDGASQVKILVAAGTEYKIAVDGKNGATGVVHLNLAFSADTKGPTVTISSPKSGAKLTNSTVIVHGKASDNLAVALVQFRLENADGTNDYQNADGTNSWSATVNNLIPGPNTIRVRAFDTTSNESVIVRSVVTYVVVSPMTATNTGMGTLSPNLNGKLLDVGVLYKMTAKPGSGQVFSNWTDVAGNVIATTAALNFTMQSNLFLQANFVPNPFIPVIGAYQGLFFDTNDPAHQSSGFFNANLASSGAFSAKVLLAGKSCSLSGQFSAGGFATSHVAGKGSPPVAAQLQLDLNGGGITGVLSNGVWTAELIAGRRAVAPVAQAGRYTLLIPGAADGVGHPGGDSYGTLVVSPAGVISFTGVLADGTKVAQKADLLVTGQWPFYAPLYSGKGSILGWLTFSNDVSSDITGTVDWFKLAQPAKFYPAGFTNGTEAIGSSYQFTNGVPVLNFSTGEFWLANGNLADSFTNQIMLDSANHLTSTNATLKLTLTPGTGLFKGSVASPDTGKAISVSGVVLQKQNFGGGFFTGTNQTGRVFLGP
jgi:hypothetical protein